MIDLGALDVWVQWVVVGLTAWIVLGGIVVLLIGRVVHARERQVPREHVDTSDEEDPALMA